MFPLNFKMGSFLHVKDQNGFTKSILGKSIFNFHILFNGSIFPFLFSALLALLYVVFPLHFIYSKYRRFLLFFISTFDVENHIWCIGCNSFQGHKQMSPLPSINSLRFALLGVKCSWEKSAIEYFTPIFHRHHLVSDQKLFSLRIELDLPARSMPRPLTWFPGVWIRLHNNTFLPIHFLPNFCIISDNYLFMAWTPKSHLVDPLRYFASEQRACLSIIFILEVV